MDEKLYNLMNWREIEGVTYSDTDKPHEILGQHIVKDGLLIQAYIPEAKSVRVINMDTKKSKAMEMADESGYFAVLLSGKKKINYMLRATYEDGNEYEFHDAYSFETSIPEQILKKFNAGIAYDIYKYLGAHTMVVNGINGVRFAVWAPYANRVSVVGEFNNWDGRRHQMSRISNTGVFEIFIPDVSAGMLYKYEIKRNGDLTSLKYDPYAFEMEKLPGMASVVADTEYQWNDTKWLENRKQSDKQASPMNIYEVSVETLEDKASEIAAYVKNMGYTHVKILNVIDSNDSPRAYFAPDASVTTPGTLKNFVNMLHGENIGVIMDIPMHHFSSEEEGMAVYDGSCLYEHDDMKKGYNPAYNTKLFNYGRPEVTNLLIASALFWTLEYHMDGINIISAAAMIYLDYGKNENEWIPNIYGGNENLEALELFRHMNSMFKKLSQGAVIIAEDNSGYQNMTGAEVTSECLGFDFKYNEGWRRDLMDYMKYDPYVRHQYYNELTLNNVYTFNDNFILPLTHDMSDDGQSTLLGKMVGNSEDKKYSNLKLMLGYYMTYPGKKMLYMENDMATYDNIRSFDTAVLENAKSAEINECVKALNKIYTSEPALFELDNSDEGFEWINNISARECIISYARKGKKADELLVIVCNFDDVDRDDYKIGVPLQGKYKEIFNSDNVKFGGKGFVNPRLKQSKTDECDGREESVRIKVPALGVSILKFSKADKKMTTNKAAKESKKK